MTKPTANSYIRFSTPEQRKGHSFQRQYELTQKYAKEHGLELNEKLTFNDFGVSAYDKSNLDIDRGLGSFIAAVNQGIIARGSYLLVESLDRITRASILDALTLFLSLLKAGITIVTMCDGTTYNEKDANDKPFQLIISITILTRGHEESLIKSQRLKSKWEYKRNNIDNKKLTGICPAWLRLNKEENKYEIVEEKATIVRRIIALTLSGIGRRKITQTLNEEGIPSIVIKSKSRTWFDSYIVKIINNRALIGEFQAHSKIDKKSVPVGEPVKDYFPRLISDEEFSLVQATLEARGRQLGGRRGASFANIFTHLLFCGYCGSRMTYVTKGMSRDRTSPWKYVRCSAAARSTGCKKKITWNYDDLEEFVLKFVRGVDFRQFAHELNGQQSILESCRANVEKSKTSIKITEEQIDRLIKAIEDEETPPKSVMSRISDLENSLEMEKRLMSINEKKAMALEVYSRNIDSQSNGMPELMESMRAATGEELFKIRARINEQIRRVVGEIVLFPGGVPESPEEIEEKRRDLIASGYSEADVDAQLQISTYSDFDREKRMLVIRNKAGFSQPLIPGNKIPDIASHRNLKFSIVMKNSRLKALQGGGDESSTA
ncbi:MAG: recombinase family protein [Paraburkholderia sp.]|uniref:recombinase family protein n=1 Tax=Paraburkholderia sp. TaxID=1926495 RepID=UPI00397B6FE9